MSSAWTKTQPEVRAPSVHGENKSGWFTVQEQVIVATESLSWKCAFCLTTPCDSHGRSFCFYCRILMNSSETRNSTVPRLPESLVQLSTFAEAATSHGHPDVWCVFIGSLSSRGIFAPITVHHAEGRWNCIHSHGCLSQRKSFIRRLSGGVTVVVCIL